jgi:hypothetical protein
MRSNTIWWLNMVYKRVGTRPFLIRDLSHDLNNLGAIRDAHLLGHIDKVGRGRGNRSLWVIVPGNVKRWFVEEVPA